MTKRVLYFLENSKSHFLILFILLTIGCGSRLIGISTLPAGFNQDEASIGYEAFSILTTGADRTGNTLPIHLVSWGNGQNVLYAYLSIPFIKLFGLTTFSVRIVNALFGVLSLWIFYALFRLVLNKKKALIGLALLTICPWSIMASRWGLESNIFPILFLCAVFFLLKGAYTSQKYYLLSFFIFAASLYSYGTSYLVVPIFLVTISIFLFKTKKISLKYWALASLIFTLTAFPILLFIIINHFDLSQINIVGITIPRLDSNRTTEIFNILSTDFPFTIIKNSFRLLNILIFQTDGSDYNAIRSIGTVYLISLPLFLIGIYNCIKDVIKTKNIHQFIFLAWLGVSLMLGITSHVNINRLNIIFFPILYFIVKGLEVAFHTLRSNYQTKFIVLTFTIYTTLFILFAGYYTTFFQEKIEKDFSGGLGEAIQYVEKNIPEGNVNISAYSVNQPYIYVCFYTKTDPSLYKQNILYKKNDVNGFRVVKSIGRYSFENSINIKAHTNIISVAEHDILKRSNVSEIKFGNYYVVERKTSHTSRTK